MRIFIDARMTKTGGTYSYTVALIDSILKLDASHNDYFVLYNKEQEQIHPEKATNIVTNSSNPVYWIYWDYVALPGIVKRFEIDIFHSLKRPSLNRVRTRKLITIHSGYHYLFPELRSSGDKYYWDRALKKTAKNADRVICVSFKDSKNVAAWCRIPEKKIDVTQLAAHRRFRRMEDPDALSEVRERLKLPDRFIVYVGTIYPVKNVATILKVFRQLLRRGENDLKLVIVGREGWGMESVKETLRELKLQDDVLFTGHQDGETLPLIYSLAELLLFPSYYEAFCAPPLEAMACGTPVVASNRGGIPEVVGGAGLLNDPDDVDGLASSCSRILSNPEFRRELVQRGYRQANSFNWEKCARKTLEVYKSVYREHEQSSIQKRCR